MTTVQTKNAQMIAMRTYQEMAVFDAMSMNHRYEILGSDFSSLYQQYNCLHGVDVSLAPEYNLDHWLDCNHPDFKPLVYQAIFYY